MVAPAFRSSGAALSTSSATPAFGVPAGVAADDIIVVCLYIGSDTVTITGYPSGFADAPGTPIVISGSGAQTTVVAWKRATGADAGTYTFTLSGSTFVEGRAMAYELVDPTGDPWDDFDFDSTPGVNTATSPPVSVDTLVDDSMLCWMASCWAGGDWTPPSGFTERLDDNVSVNTFADMVQATAGASGSISGTCTNSDKQTAWLGVLRPIPSGVDPSEGSVAIGLGLAVAAVGSRNSSGAVGVGLGLAVAAAGRRDSSGVAAIGLGLAVAGAGRRDSSGVVGMGLGLAPTTAGVRSSRGAAAVTLRLALNAVGTTTSGRPGRLTARSRSQALRARGASVRLVTRGGYADA